MGEEGKGKEEMEVGWATNGGRPETEKRHKGEKEEGGENERRRI